MKKLLCALVGVLCCGLVVLLPFLKPSTEFYLNSQKEYKAILKIWQIDSFEGGTGSRGAFLKEISSAFSKKYSGILTIVTPYTVEGAKESIREGKLPDIISYGGCGIDVFKYASNLAVANLADGGQIDDKRYAVAWARGGYFKIVKSSTKQVKTTIISEGEYNSGVVATMGVKEVINPVVLPPSQAFNKFMVSESCALIGTQRDIVRLGSRGVEFEATPIDYFSDLYQYVSVTSNSADKRKYANMFINYLLSKTSQQKLSKIKMFSTTGIAIYGENDCFSQFEQTKILYTVSPYAQMDTILKIKSLAVESIFNDGDDRPVINFLKHL